MLRSSSQPYRPDEAVRQCVAAAARHAPKALAALGCAVALALLATAVSPRKYHSEGKLAIRLGRENVTLDPAAMIGPETVVAATAEARESEVNSVAEVLRSRVLWEKTIDELGPAAILGLGVSAVQSDAPAGWTASMMSVFGLPPQTPREKALRRFERSFSVEPVRKSNVIAVSYQAAAPELAQAVVAKMLELYTVEHARLNRGTGAHPFLEAETERLKTELAAAERRLRDLKNQTGMASPETQRQLVVNRVGRLEDESLKNSAALAASRAKLAHLEKTLAALPETEVTDRKTGMGDFGTDQMRSQLYTLQLREQQLAARYTADHPLLEETRRQLREAQAALDGEERTRTEITTGRGRAHEQVQLAALNEKAQYAALEVESRSLAAQLADARGRLSELNDAELQVASVQREIQLVEANYRRYATNLEQSRIDEARQERRLSNISIVQPATLEPRPTSPRLWLNLALGLLAGGFAAAAVVLAGERLDRSVRTPAELADAIDVPVFGSVPRLSGTKVLHAQK